MMFLYTRYLVVIQTENKVAVEVDNKMMGLSSGGEAGGASLKKKSTTGVGGIILVVCACLYRMRH